MQRRIHHLDSLTIDKIAAGEVIDVPASCVKELVENALDAGAEDILIEVQVGGRELIRVTDTGCGMCREDVETAIERHATSKILCVEDLEKISSMGFRGEALASIVAISRVRITSAEKGGESPLSDATTLVAEGGEVKSIVTTKAPSGTMVEVRDLFYNVPARRKFLKSPSKDTQDIIKVITSLALASPKTSFRLLVDGKEVVFAQKEESGSLVARAKKLLKEPFQNGFEVHHKEEGCSLCGIVCSPEFAKTNRSGQYLFVNGRSVFSLPISYAVKNGCGSSCEQQKHPQFVLHLTLDPASIDINVHPQKKEIRFADEEWVRAVVQEKVSEAIFGMSRFSFQQEKPFDTSAGWFSSIGFDTTQGEIFPQLFSVADERPETIPPNGYETKVLAVLGGIAVIQTVEMHNQLTLLDIQRAMKAALHSELLEKRSKRHTEVLLLPIMLECSQEEAFLVASMTSEIASQGFLLRPFGPTSFLIEEVPQGLKELDIKECILSMVRHPEILREKNEVARCARLAGLYTSLMQGLHPPISLEFARAVCKRYVEAGSPKVAPDGAACSFSLTCTHIEKFFD